MKIYKDRNYRSHRTNDPISKNCNVSNRDEFCCEELFNSNCDIYLSYWYSEPDIDTSTLVFGVYGEEGINELDNIKFCPFCGEKFELIFKNFDKHKIK